MKTRGFLSTLFAIMAVCTLQLHDLNCVGRLRQVFCPVAVASGGTGSLRRAEDHDRVEAHASEHSFAGVRERGLAVVGRRQYVSRVDRVARPEEYISPLDCPEYAYPRGGLGHPLRM